MGFSGRVVEVCWLSKRNSVIVRISDTERWGVKTRQVLMPVVPATTNTDAAALAATASQTHTNTYTYVPGSVGPSSIEAIWSHLEGRLI